jgi:hypothetical protein
MIPKGFAYKMNMAATLMLVFFCFSCSEGEKPGQGILPQDEMVKALTEIYLAEQKINKLALPRDSSEREFERFKHVIFQKINVSDSTFKRSFNYYMDHPIEMEKIYTALVDSLSLMEQRLESPKKE